MNGKSSGNDTAFWSYQHRIFCVQYTYWSALVSKIYSLFAMPPEGNNVWIELNVWMSTQQQFCNYKEDDNK